MNLHQIELFIAIAETGSFSRAAEAASLNQSTVSQHIAALEEEIGTSLLDRTPRGALLTSSGKIFLRHARRILAERESLFQAMQAFSGLEQAQLRISASNIPANYLIPALLPNLAQRYPGIVVQMATGDSQEMIDQLLAAETELALVGSRFTDKGLVSTPLVDDSLVLVVGPEHPLSEQQSIGVTDLADHPLVIREEGSGSGKALEQAFAASGLDVGRLRVAARLGSNEAVMQAVAANFGCAFVSELALGSRIESGELSRVEIEGFSVSRKIWLVRMRDRSLSPAAEAFCELLLEQCDVGLD